MEKCYKSFTRFSFVSFQFHRVQWMFIVFVGGICRISVLGTENFLLNLIRTARIPTNHCVFLFFSFLFIQTISISFFFHLVSNSHLEFSRELNGIFNYLLAKNEHANRNDLYFCLAIKLFCFLRRRRRRLLFRLFFSSSIQQRWIEIESKSFFSILFRASSLPVWISTKECRDRFMAIFFLLKWNWKMRFEERMVQRITSHTDWWQLKILKFILLTFMTISCIC